MAMALFFVIFKHRSNRDLRLAYEQRVSDLEVALEQTRVGGQDMLTVSLTPPALALTCPAPNVRATRSPPVDPAAPTQKESPYSVGERSGVVREESVAEVPGVMGPLAINESEDVALTDDAPVHDDEMLRVPAVQERIMRVFENKQRLD